MELVGEFIQACGDTVVLRVINFFTFTEHVHGVVVAFFSLGQELFHRHTGFCTILNHIQGGQALIHPQQIRVILGKLAETIFSEPCETINLIGNLFTLRIILAL